MNWLNMLDVDISICQPNSWCAAICQVIYRALTGILIKPIGMFCDLLHIAFYIFAGVDIQAADGSGGVYDVVVAGERKNILDYFLFSDVVTKSYMWLSIIGLLLIVIFTGYKIIKQDYFEKTGPRSKGPIFRNVAISCISFLLVIPIFYLVIHSSSLLAVVVMEAMGMNVNQFAGAKIYELSWSDNGAVMNVVNGAISGHNHLMWMGQLNKDTWFALGVEYKYVKYDYSLMNKLGSGTGGVTWSGGSSTLMDGGVMFSDTTVSGSIEFYWYLYLVGAIVGIKTLYKLMLAMIQRIFMLLGLLIVAPSPISQYVLDDGQKFKSWLSQTIQQGLRLVVAVMSFSIFLISLGLIGGIDFVSAFQGALDEADKASMSAETANITTNLLANTATMQAAIRPTMLISADSVFGEIINAFMRIFLLMGAGGAVTDLDALLTPLISGAKNSLDAGATGQAANAPVAAVSGAAVALAGGAIGGIAGRIHNRHAGGAGRDAGASEAQQELNNNPSTPQGPEPTQGGGTDSPSPTTPGGGPSAGAAQEASGNGEGTPDNAEAPEGGAPEDGGPEDGGPEDGAPEGGAPEGGPEDGAPEDVETPSNEETSSNVENTSVENGTQAPEAEQGKESGQTTNANENADADQDEKDNADGKEKKDNTSERTLASDEDKADSLKGAIKKLESGKANLNKLKKKDEKWLNKKIGTGAGYKTGAVLKGIGRATVGTLYGAGKGVLGSLGTGLKAAGSSLANSTLSMVLGKDLAKEFTKNAAGGRMAANASAVKAYEKGKVKGYNAEKKKQLAEVANSASKKAKRNVAAAKQLSEAKEVQAEATTQMNIAQADMINAGTQADQDTKTLEQMAVNSTETRNMLKTQESIDNIEKEYGNENEIQQKIEAAEKAGNRSEADKLRATKDELISYKNSVKEASHNTQVQREAADLFANKDGKLDELKEKYKLSQDAGWDDIQQAVRENGTAQEKEIFDRKYTRLNELRTKYGLDDTADQKTVMRAITNKDGADVASSIRASLASDGKFNDRMKTTFNSDAAKTARESNANYEAAKATYATTADIKGQADNLVNEHESRYKETADQYVKAVDLYDQRSGLAAFENNKYKKTTNYKDIWRGKMDGQNGMKSGGLFAKIGATIEEGSSNRQAKRVSKKAASIKDSLNEKEAKVNNFLSKEVSSIDTEVAINDRLDYETKEFENANKTFETTMGSITGKKDTTSAKIKDIVEANSKKVGGVTTYDVSRIKGGLTRMQNSNAVEYDTDTIEKAREAVQTYGDKRQQFNQRKEVLDSAKEIVTNAKATNKGFEEKGNKLYSEFKGYKTQADVMNNVIKKEGKNLTLEEKQIIGTVTGKKVAANAADSTVVKQATNARDILVQRQQVVGQKTEELVKQKQDFNAVANQLVDAVNRSIGNIKPANNAAAQGTTTNNTVNNYNNDVTNTSNMNPASHFFSNVSMDEMPAASGLSQSKDLNTYYERMQVESAKAMEANMAQLKTQTTNIELGVDSLNRKVDQISHDD